MPDKPTPPQFLARFRRNTPRLVSLVALIAALVVLIIGAGFSEISQSGAPTPLETLAVRWVVLACLAIGVVAYFIGSRLVENDQP